MPDVLVVGTLGRAVGLRGEIEVSVQSDNPRRFESGSRLLLPDGRPLTVRTFRRHRDRMIVAFEEVADRTGAEALRGLDVVVPASEARPLDEDEYWDHDLIGCRVVTDQDAELGEVGDVLHSAAQDLLVVGDRLIPMVAEIVLEISLAERRIVVRTIEGLTDEA